MNMNLFFPILQANLIVCLAHSYALFLIYKISPPHKLSTFDSITRFPLIFFASLLGTGYLAPYSIYFSAPFSTATQWFIAALFVSFYTDLKTLLISRTVTLYLIPAVWLAAYNNLLPLSLYESVIGTISGYCLLWVIAQTAAYYYKQEAIGQGDIELLAFIGSYVGFYSCWKTLLIGSIVGSLASLIYVAITHQKNVRTVRLPFGSFLVIGAVISLFF